MAITKRSFGIQVPKLSDKQRSTFRYKLSELEAIIIDEISMVSHTRLLLIHQRLVEIFGCSPFLSFAGIAVIAVGDFYQLPPIRRQQVFAPFKNELLNLMHPWHEFSICELTEVMRQRGNGEFIDILNHVRDGSFTNQHLFVLETRMISEKHCKYPLHALHIFVENFQKTYITK